MMKNTLIRTHNAFKALQRAGIADRQAEAMLEVFTPMQQSQPGKQISKQLGQIRTSVHQTDSRFDRFMVRVDQTDNRVSQLTTKVDQMDTHLGLLATKIHHIDERLGHVERKTDKLAVRFNHLEIRMDKLEALLSDMNVRLTSAVDNLRNDVAGLSADMRWIKRLSILMTTTLLAAVLKDILL